MRRNHRVGDRRGPAARLALAMLVSASVWTSAASPAHAVGDGTKDLTLRVGNLKLRAFKRYESQVRALIFTSENGLFLKTEMAYPTFAGKIITSRIGMKADALAAVNGGFGIQDRTYALKHALMIDGELMTTGRLTAPGYLLSITADGTEAWIGRPNWGEWWRIHARQGDIEFDIRHWNASQPARGKVAAFTARGGNSRYPIDRNCSALLAPLSGRTERDRVYKVLDVRSRCGRQPLQPPEGRWHQVVLVGDPVRDLVVGEQLELTMALGKEGVTQIFGGVPRLVKDGENVGPRCFGPCSKNGPGPDRPFYARNPRTALGISQGCSDKDPATNCKFIVVTVDGRQSGWSEGVRFPPLGQLMLDLGAHNALNMDGGGSTAMWMTRRTKVCESRTSYGCLVNRPSYGERPRLNAVVIVPGEA